LAALMLIAVGGDRLWRSPRAPAGVSGAVHAACLADHVAGADRAARFLRLNDAYLSRSEAALAADADAARSSTG